jgi:ribosomal protein L7Ae-like RNA K-turn-binding protein
MRAGRVVLGTHAVKERARRGELDAVVMADDATDNARSRVLPLLAAVEVPVVRCASAIALGRAVGRSRLVVVGIRDARFAEKILAALPPMAGDGAPEDG